MNIVQQALKQMDVTVFSVSDNLTFTLEGPVFDWIHFFFSQQRSDDNKFTLTEQSPFFLRFCAKCNIILGESQTISF